MIASKRVIFSRYCFHYTRNLLRPFNFNTTSLAFTRGMSTVDETIKNEVEHDVKQEIKTESNDENTKVDEKAKLPYYVGAHVSAAGGLWHAPENAHLLGASAFALFLKSQRQWVAKPISDKDTATFKETMQKYGFKPNQVLPHGSYLCNIGSSNDELYEKAKNSMLEECRRVEQLGLQYLNIHPGSTAGKCTKEESIKRISDAINYIHKNTKYMTIVLENTAGGGGTIGVSFKELKTIIDKIENKERIGVCIDTCHAFASGINVAIPNAIQKMVNDFESTIGLKYLKGMHLNDSTGDLNSNRDMHKPIGEGCIGLDCFRQIMNCDALRGIPLILETPHKDKEYGPEHGWAKEIRTLEGLVGVESVPMKKRSIDMMFSVKTPAKKEKKTVKKEKTEKTEKTDKTEKKTIKKEKTEKKTVKKTRTRKTKVAKQESSESEGAFSVESD